MSQIKILKYTYNAPGSFQVDDEYGSRCWIKFVQEGEIENTKQQIEYKDLPIEQGF